MARRLVQIGGGQASIALGDRDLLIGRDETADVFVPSSRVSRRHALLAPRGDTHCLTDLGSANGTRVNGHELSGSVMLAPGDLIDVGDARFRYEEVGSGPRRAALAAALALGSAAVAAALLVWWPSGGDGLGDAVALARDAVAAHARGEEREAKTRLNEAVALLVARGHLDTVPPQRVRQEALALLQSRLDPPVDLMNVYESALLGSRPRAPDPAPEAPSAAGLGRQGPCRTDRVSGGDLSLCIRERAERILIDLWADPRDIPDEFYGAVEQEFRTLAAQRRAWVESSLARGRDLRPMMEAELEAANMPRMLFYLSMIESGYDRGIQSPAGARGLWQFMPATARSYGLRVEGAIDERTDPSRSTRAAARYLKDLAFEFGGDALLLAIASYNKGENGIRRALKKLDDPRTERSYWVLVERGLIPAETRDYVPRLVAAAIMGEAGVPPEEVVSSSR
jgi:hypothetical protein